jgi:hypothetical protein
MERQVVGFSEHTAPDVCRRAGHVLVMFQRHRYPALMHADGLTPADPSDLADALAYALRFQGRKRVHNADEIMAEIVAKRLVEHLERAGFVVMKRPADVGAAALGRGFERQ